MNSDDTTDLDHLIAPALRPASGDGGAVRARLLQRAAESRARHLASVSVRRDGSPWRELMKGLRGRDLRHTDGGSSVLLALDPGTVLPMHRHRYLEEGLVLSGRMQMGVLDLGPGDYHVSFPGSRHDRITSTGGCITYLRGTSLGSLFGVAVELLGGLVPGAGDAPVTITEADGEWRTLADGVAEKRLWQTAAGGSRFVRLAPGSRYCPEPYARECEFMVVAGEVFFGDILLRQEELHIAPVGTSHPDISSDCGGTFFVHERTVF